MALKNTENKTKKEELFLKQLGADGAPAAGGILGSGKPAAQCRPDGSMKPCTGGCMNFTAMN